MPYTSYLQSHIFLRSLTTVLPFKMIQCEYFLWYLLRYFSIAVVLFISIQASVSAKASSVALVIGNSSYQHTPALANPSNDAADLSAALSKLGFKVILAKDLTKNSLEQVIIRFAGLVDQADLALFYYAGHGLQVEGRNYLVPIDARLETPHAIDFELISLDLVQRTMERGSPTNLIFLDACRNNPLTRNLAKKMGTRSVSLGKGLAATEAGVGTLISFSTQPGNVAVDGVGRNSPFNKALVKHIQVPGAELMNTLIKIRNDVMKHTQDKQVPWEHSALRSKIYFSQPQLGIAQLIGPPPEVSKYGQAAEISYWESVKNSRDPALLQSYLDRFPNGLFTELARLLIAKENTRTAALEMKKLNKKPGSKSGGREAGNKKRQNHAAGKTPPGKKVARLPNTKKKQRLRLPGGGYSSSWGRVKFHCSKSGQCTGRYKGTGDGKSAKIVGTITRSGKLSGIWVEKHSLQRCGTQKYGSYYWGKASLKFNQERSSWRGRWGYCGASATKNFNGSR